MRMMVWNKKRLLLLRVWLSLSIISLSFESFFEPAKSVEEATDTTETIREPSVIYSSTKWNQGHFWKRGWWNLGWFERSGMGRYQRLLPDHESNADEVVALEFYRSSAKDVIVSTSHDRVKLLARGLKQTNLKQLKSPGNGREDSLGQRFIRDSLKLLDSDQRMDEHEWLWLHGAVQAVSSISKVNDEVENVYDPKKYPGAVLENSLLEGYEFREKIGAKYKEFLNRPVKDSELTEVSERGHLAKEVAKLEPTEDEILQEFSPAFRTFFEIPRMVGGELSDEQLLNKELLPSFKALIMKTKISSGVSEKGMLIEMMAHLSKFSKSFKEALNKELRDEADTKWLGQPHEILLLKEKWDDVPFFQALTYTQLQLVLEKIRQSDKPQLQPLQRIAREVITDDFITRLTDAAFHSLSVSFSNEETMEIQYQIYHLNSLLSQINTHREFRDILGDAMQFDLKDFQRVIRIWEWKYSGINLLNMPPFSLEYKLLMNEVVLASADRLTMIDDWKKSNMVPTHAWVVWKRFLLDEAISEWGTPNKKIPDEVFENIVSYLEGAERDKKFARFIWETIGFYRRLDPERNIQIWFNKIGDYQKRINRLWELAQETLKSEAKMSESQIRTNLPLAHSFVQKWTELKNTGEI